MTWAWKDRQAKAGTGTSHREGLSLSVPPQQGRLVLSCHGMAMDRQVVERRKEGRKWEIQSKTKL